MFSLSFCYLLIHFQLWDVGKQKKLRTMTGHSARVGSLSWNTHILSRFVKLFEVIAVINCHGIFGFQSSLLIWRSLQNFQTKNSFAKRVLCNSRYYRQYHVP